NHASMAICEMCGAALRSVAATSTDAKADTVADAAAAAAAQDPAHAELPVLHPTDVVKLSFRSGGDKLFYERLKGALQQRKWMLANAPPAPRQPSSSSSTLPLRGGGQTAAALGTDTSTPPSAPPVRAAVGITTLERQRLAARHENEAVIGDAFEDLETLMASATRIIALAESFAATTITSARSTDRDHPASGNSSDGGAADKRALPPSSTSSSSSSSSDAAALQQEATAVLAQLGSSLTTKAALGSGSAAESLYLTELARSLADWLTTTSTATTTSSSVLPRTGAGSLLSRSGGIMALSLNAAAHPLLHGANCRNPCVRSS
ncbi:hypothetical protein KEM52_003684, partial [Ascosphaera acerosa]